MPEGRREGGKEGRKRRTNMPRLEPVTMAVRFDMVVSWLVNEESALSRVLI